MKAILDQEAVRIAYCAAKSEARPVLQCVRIGEGEIAAADGFILARKPIPTEPESGEVILVKAEDILKAKREWKAKSLAIESDSIDRAVIKDETGSCTMETELVQGNFPDIDKFFPATDEKARIALAKDYLALISKIAAADENIVKLKIREAAEPVEFTIGKTRGLVMPMMYDWEE